MKRLFLHGLGQGPESWDGVLHCLSEGENCCPDLSAWRGEGPVCYETLYRGLESFCGESGEPLDLCGLSLGGVLALHYTLRHPDRVHALILIAAQYRMPKRLLKLQNAVFRFLPERAFSGTGFGKQDFLTLSQSMLDLDFQEELGEITAPVLVVCGEKDRANRKAAQGLRERIPTAELVLVPGAGHEVNFQAPETLGKALADFLCR